MFIFFNFVTPHCSGLTLSLLSLNHSRRDSFSRSGVRMNKNKVFLTEDGWIRQVLLDYQLWILVLFNLLLLQSLVILHVSYIY